VIASLTPSVSPRITWLTALMASPPSATEARFENSLQLSFGDDLPHVGRFSSYNRLRIDGRRINGELLEQDVPEDVPRNTDTQRATETVEDGHGVFDQDILL
jgi:hypothetical protein